MHKKDDAPSPDRGLRTLKLGNQAEGLRLGEDSVLLSPRLLLTPRAGKAHHPHDHFDFTHQGPSHHGPSAAVHTSPDSLGFGTFPGHQKLAPHPSPQKAPKSPRFHNPTVHQGLHRPWFRMWTAGIVLALLLLQAPLLLLYFQGTRYMLEYGPSEPLKVVFATILCSDELADPCAVLVHRLKKLGTPHNILVLVGSSVSRETSEQLMALNAMIEPLPLESPSRTPSLAVDPSVAPPPACNFPLLHLWNLTYCDLVVYIDPTMLVLEQLDELFRRPSISAAPDGSFPDQFSSKLMVLKPERSTYIDMLARRGKQADRPHAEQAFLNKYFSTWYSLPSEHRLPSRYNVPISMRTASSGGIKRAKAVQVQGSGLGSQGVGGWRAIALQGSGRAEQLWWEAFVEMRDFLAERSVPASNLSSECRDGPAIRTLPKGGAQPLGPEGSGGQQLSVLLCVEGPPPANLADLIHKFLALDFVHAVYVAGAQKTFGASLVPAHKAKLVEFLPSHSGRCFEHFQPIRSLETECVLLCDATVEVSEDALRIALLRWSDNPWRMVGFFPRGHYFLPHQGRSQQQQLAFVSSPRVAYSMVQTKMALLHADYLRSLACQLSEGTRATLSQHPQCLSIAVNFLVSHTSGKPPLLVLDPAWQEGALSALNANADEESEGKECLNIMHRLWGYTPIKNTSEAVGLYKAGGSVLSSFALRPDQAEKTLGPNDWSPVFDFERRVSKHPDENLMFMPLVETTFRLPEISLVPSETLPHLALLCVRGNDTEKGPDNKNQYMLVQPSLIPVHFRRLQGTTFILLSRHGFEDSPLLLLELLGSLFEFVRDVRGFPAQRVLLYKYGAHVSSLPESSLELLQALLGADITPFAIRGSKTPICFERAAIIRRNRGLLVDRPGLLPQLRDRIWHHCAGGRPLTALRVTVLNEVRGGARGRLLGVLELVGRLQQECGELCRPFVINFPSTRTFCHQVRAMRLASVVVAPHGEALASTLHVMTPGSMLLELAAPAQSSSAPLGNSTTQGSLPIAQESKEFNVERQAAALGLHYRRMVSQPQLNGPTPPGPTMLANGTAVVQAIMLFIQELVRTGVPAGKGSIPLPQQGTSLMGASQKEGKLRGGSAPPVLIDARSAPALALQRNPKGSKPRFLGLERGKKAAAKQQD